MNRVTKQTLHTREQPTARDAGQKRRETNQSAIGHLARSIGNQGLSARPGAALELQRKLLLGSSTDPYEKEADRIAALVIGQSGGPPRVESHHGPDSSATGTEASGHSRHTPASGPSTRAGGTAGIATAPGAGSRRQPPANGVTPLVRRRSGPDAAQTDTGETPAGPSAEASAGSVLALSGIPDPYSDPAGRACKVPVRQAKSAAAGAYEPSPQAANLIRGLRGGGRPLNRTERAYFDPRFGTSFAHVRVHRGDQAAAAAHAVNARAFTLGRDVIFARDAPSLSSREGRRLMAHELTHVLQQNGVSSAALQPQPWIQRAPGGTRISFVLIVDKDRTNNNAELRLLVNGSVVLYLDTTLETGSSRDPGTFFATFDVKRQHLQVLSAGSGPKFATIRFRGGGKQAKSDERRYKKLIKSIGGDRVTFSIFENSAGSGVGAKGVGASKGAGGGSASKPGSKGGAGGISEQDRKMLARFSEKLKASGREVSADPALLDALKGLSNNEQTDFSQLFARGGKGVPTDLTQALLWYTSLDQAQREILRTNLELAGSDSALASELPEEVRLNIKDSAKDNTELAKEVDHLNDALARAHALISKKGGDTSQLDPIDLSKLPIFNEMVMMEGLLAGASLRSTEIQNIARDLTSNIRALRGVVREEIAWLAGELAVGTIIGALASGASFGIAAAGAVGRAALLIRRLNKLRNLLEQINNAYQVYSRVRAIVPAIEKGFSAYQSFRNEFETLRLEYEKLKAEVDAVDDPADALLDKLDALEHQLFERIQAKLDKGDLDALMENFFLPDDVTEDELQELLLNIPRGIEAFRELAAFYDPQRRGDLQYSVALQQKAIRAGLLLFPVVGMLANLAGDALARITAPKHLADRLTGSLGRIAGSRGKRRGKSGKDAGSRLRSAGKARTKKAVKPAKPPATKGKDRDKPADAAKKKRTKDDADKKKTPKGKVKDDLAWASLGTEIRGLGTTHAENGITKRRLKSEVARVKRKHPRVAGSSSVRDEAKRGYWRVKVARKRVKGTKGSTPVIASVRMTRNTRWSAGKQLIESRLRAMDLQRKLTRADIERGLQLSKVKTDYAYDLLSVTPIAGAAGRFRVTGKMGKSEAKQIALIEDLVGLHQGTDADPIPIYWYKNPSTDYRSKITLATGMGRKSKDFAMVARPGSGEQKNILFKKKTIMVGIWEKHLITKDKKIKRKSTPRSGSKQKNYHEALKSRGFDMSAQGLDADHVRDLAFAGKDDYENLWPLKSAINRWAFTGKWYRRYGIEYLDSGQPGQVKKSTLFKKNMSGKFFRIKGFKQQPEKLGGRDPR